MRADSIIATSDSSCSNLRCYNQYQDVLELLRHEPHTDSSDLILILQTSVIMDFSFQIERSWSFNSLRNIYATSGYVSIVWRLLNLTRQIR